MRATVMATGSRETSDMPSTRFLGRKKRHVHTAASNPRPCLLFLLKLLLLLRLVLLLLFLLYHSLLSKTTSTGFRMRLLYQRYA